MNPIESADNFLLTGNKFRLGHLVTEQPHPLTQHLSDWVESDVNKAISSLKKVDELALKKFTGYLADVEKLREKIQEVLSGGGRIFLCGCGATGRLSLTLESLWRQLHKDSEQVQAFMAGGDVALVHAIEGFEDFPQLGANQLVEKGFTANDLLISCTEGGETPFVIGATEKALQLSHHKPFFIYCNPRETLIKTVERSQKIIEDPEIVNFCWEIGPMSLAGSTRMQASTVLQWGVGLALFCEKKQIKDYHQKLIKIYLSLAHNFLSDFILKESDIYKNGEWIHYFVDSYGITAFTDTTERSPTFSLQPFAPLESHLKNLSLSYITLLGTRTSKESWCKLLNREPHCLDWQGQNQLSYDYLYRFDFSERAYDLRKDLTDKKIHKFFIYDGENGFDFQLSNNLQYQLELPKTHPLINHMILKMLLNIHSTLVMGKMGRYKNNLMTWVKPSNGKLIDRACRYIQLLLQYDGITSSYEDVVRELFRQLMELQVTESIVLKTYRAMSID
ncbi:MAG: hypothetical protein H6625_01250 [Bdellovibrionaceae bacterium]|nr:hypothetical protein [Pseudobdellovibrionaceae bacterium]